MCGVARSGRDRGGRRGSEGAESRRAVRNCRPWGAAESLPARILHSGPMVHCRSDLHWVSGPTEAAWPLPPPSLPRSRPSPRPCLSLGRPGLRSRTAPAHRPAHPFMLPVTGPPSGDGLSRASRFQRRSWLSCRHSVPTTTRPPRPSPRPTSSRSSGKRDLVADTSQRAA